jgi:hypothetical protein
MIFSLQLIQDAIYYGILLHKQVIKLRLDKL